ncbi:MAG: hypothetical protein NUV55_13260 [Sulfuricaulis sp.]|nr:hypothetical protein [Sulfuricaulis sp.]MCR4348150.1 hypothetical protein [Sulfuricaulis sp.]
MSKFHSLAMEGLPAVPGATAVASMSPGPHFLVRALSGADAR